MDVCKSTHGVVENCIGCRRSRSSIDIISLLDDALAGILASRLLTFSARPSENLHGDDDPDTSDDQPKLTRKGRRGKHCTRSFRIAHEIKFNKELLLNSELFHASNHEIIQVLKNLNNDLESVILVAHNPGITIAINSLTGSEISNVPTCGIAAIEIKAENWNQIRFKENKLLFYDYPKNAKH